MGTFAARYKAGRFSYIETRAVLGGAYRGAAATKSLLTHSYDEDAGRTLCNSVNRDSVADHYAQDVDAKPTCSTCLARDPRFNGAQMAQTFDGVQRGDRVRTDTGETGKVVDVQGDRVVVELADGESLLTSSKFLTKMESVIMAQKKIRCPQCHYDYNPSDIHTSGPNRGKCLTCAHENKREREAEGHQRDEGRGEYEVPMQTSATCPYCAKPNVSMSGGLLGDHRALGGVCDGSRRRVERVVEGRAVLMSLKNPLSANVLFTLGRRVMGS